MYRRTKLAERVVQAPVVVLDGHERRKGLVVKAKAELRLKSVHPEVCVGRARRQHRNGSLRQVRHHKGHRYLARPVSMPHA